MITFRVLRERRSLGPRHVREQKDVRTTLILLPFVVSFTIFSTSRYFTRDF